MSHCTPIAPGSVDATRCAAATSISTHATRAPSCAKRRAMPSPNPAPAPVTIAVLPASLLASATLEHGLALLDEGALRLLRVLALRQLDRHVLLDAVAVGERQVLDGVERLLEHLHRERALLGNLPGKPGRFGHQLARRNARLQRAEAIELMRGNAAPGEEQHPRLRRREETLEELDAASEADVDFRHREHRVLAREDDVAAQRERESRTQCRAVDRGDHRLVAVDRAIEHLAYQAIQLAVFAGLAGERSEG